MGNLQIPVCHCHGTFKHLEPRGDFLSSRKQSNQITKYQMQLWGVYQLMFLLSSRFEHWPSSGISSLWPQILPTIPLDGFAESALPTWCWHIILSDPPYEEQGCEGFQGHEQLLTEENKMPAPPLFGWHNDPVLAGSLKGCCKIVITGRVQLVSLWNTERRCSGNGFEC